jgi:tetratricopeptide (TPR) repeat protein
VGTPAYTSPEQVTAGRIPLDHRTDIYSLGATLYELLTLQPSFTGKQRDQVLAQIVHKEPRAPRGLNRKVPVDLETICLKALEKDPDRRYQTAGQMAEDLRRYLNRFTISARRVGPVQRLVKWVRRRPTVAASLACLLIAVCAALALGYRVHRSEQQRQIEQEQAERRLRDEQSRARAQLLEEKVRNAYLIAGSGDLKKIEETIKEIETLDASTGQVRLLRGMVAYFSSDLERAISELEQAVKLMPESIVARALLATSFMDFGNWERAGALIRELEKLTPASPEDYLFKGFSREGYQPRTGVQDLDEGIRRRDSPLGRWLRASARANLAAETGKVEQAESALADANTALAMLPNEPEVLATRVYACVVAAGIYREVKRMERSAAVLEVAARDVEALGPSIELPRIALSVSLYYEVTGDPQRAFEIARRSLDRSGNALVASICVKYLYREGRFTDALECLRQRRRENLDGDVERAFVLAELPDGPRLAVQEYEKINERYPKDWTQLYILLLLGKHEQVLAILRAKCGYPHKNISRDSVSWRDTMELYLCGETSEDNILSAAGASRSDQILTRYNIALRRLAKGDRAGARYHFQKAIDTRVYFRSHFYWSQMFLSRLEKDPTWPPWIVLKP